MPAELTDQADLAVHPGFVARVRAAAVTAAVAVAAEIAAEDNTSILRRALATNVLLDSETYAKRFSWAVVTNAEISLSSSSNDIKYTVNSMWNAMAGVPPTPPA